MPEPRPGGDAAARVAGRRSATQEARQDRLRGQGGEYGPPISGLVLCGCPPAAARDSPSAVREKPGVCLGRRPTWELVEPHDAPDPAPALPPNAGSPPILLCRRSAELTSRAVLNSTPDSSSATTLQGSSLPSTAAGSGHRRRCAGISSGTAPKFLLAAPAQPSNTAARGRAL